jgi:hypothetical protein
MNCSLKCLGVVGWRLPAIVAALSMLCGIGAAGEAGPKPVGAARSHAPPRGLHFSNNLLPPGTDGVSNVHLKP